MVSWKKYCFNLAEGFRCATEYVEFRLGRDDLYKSAPKGDGHPVLIIPAFTEHDALTQPLHDVLKEMGYKTYGWKNGFNLGLDEDKAEQLRDRLKQIYQQNGQHKVTIIGLSLGGIFARELGREFPEMVRNTISVRSPFGAGLQKNAVPALVKGAINLLSATAYSLKCEGMAERLATPPGVPTTSIYSKTDGIAGWQACLNPKSDSAENIEVNGSHIGGFWNLEALGVILDRVAQPAGEWKPYTLPANHSPSPDQGWKNKTAGKKPFFPHN